jgi:glycosyltransferase involved in cell wall biosynthesis
MTTATRHLADRPTEADSPKVAFVLEQTLGHITHSANLCALVPDIGVIDPIFLPVAFDVPRSLPVWSNWTVRAGIRADRALRSSRERGEPIDAIFVHTQVPAILLGRWMRRIPTVVSLDATPKQYDDLGAFYAHATSPRPVERLKSRLNRRCYERAAHLVTWSDWTRHDLIENYGVDADRITTIPPGVDLERWSRPAESENVDGVVRVLFVGGDMQRKGGDVLIQTVQRLRSDPALPTIEAHLVTNATVPASPGVVVHRGLTPNDPGLIALYHKSDIFCLPTRADCLPMVLAEAAAAGLPLVATDVGAIHEIVVDGVSGALVAEATPDDLVAALHPLVADVGLRATYGFNALAIAREHHDARANASRLSTLLRDLALAEN